MTDLHALLARTVDHPVDLDTVADVRRGRAALTRRRRRTGLAAAAAAAVAVLGSQTLPQGHLLGIGPSDEMKRPTVSTGYFTIPEPPRGWAVQASGDHLVVIAPEGLPKVDLSDPQLNFRVTGKLVLEYETDTFGELEDGEPITYDGRTFYDIEHTGGGARLVTTSTGSGTWLVLQEAPDLHWSVQQMIEFLDRVQITGAVPST
jgi:hypothetical protein